MRKYFLLIAAFFLANTLNAQISIGVNLNLNSQPAWGPTGYDYAEYYYMPDIEVYYNVPQHRYYYNQEGQWRYSANLPARFHDYDLYNSYKVVVNEERPWRNHDFYREKYSSYRDRHDQEPIRDSRDSKYFSNRNHPEYGNWVKEHKGDNGNHKGWYKGNNGNHGNHGHGNNKNEDDDQKDNRDKKDRGGNIE